MSVEWLRGLLAIASLVQSIPTIVVVPCYVGFVDSCPIVKPPLRLAIQKNNSVYVRHNKTETTPCKIEQQQQQHQQKPSTCQDQN